MSSSGGRQSLKSVRIGGTEQRDEHSPHATQLEGGGARTVNIKKLDMSVMDD
jgi:hypothetical protein